jgi:hypothetical protein
LNNKQNTDKGKQINKKEDTSKIKYYRAIASNFIKEVRLGVKHAQSFPTLPEKIDKFHNNIITRTLRVMSGCVVILYLILKNNPNINIEIFNYVPKLAFITVLIIHFIYIAFISIMRALSVRTLIKNKKYEVRNSPIRVIQTASGKVYLCVKGFCSLMMIGGGAVGALTGIDDFLVRTDRPRIFTPIIVKQADRLFNFIG